MVQSYGSLESQKSCAYLRERDLSYLILVSNSFLQMPLAEQYAHLDVNTVLKIILKNYAHSLVHYGVVNTDFR